MTDPIGYTHPPAGTQPPYRYPPYVSTLKRAPTRALHPVAATLSEVTGPSFADRWAGPDRVDLTRISAGGHEAQGQRIIIAGRVLDGDGAPVAHTLVEIWQANAAGRYRHDNDRHDAPLDPHFTGAGQALTNTRGEYRFLTIRPGNYPWRNTHNAWRAAHIHFSLFGPAFATRLVTQMYFPGDPTLAVDPIVMSVDDKAARNSMIATWDHELTEAEFALGYRWDIVLRGRAATHVEAVRWDLCPPHRRPSDRFIISASTIPAGTI
jgi:protocatechuate 3,4-dioxygenase, beta subunit